MIEYNNFSEIEHSPLRAYNRCAFVSNLLEDFGLAPAQDYLAQFSEKEKMEMYTIFDLIRKQGLKKTREGVTKGLVFLDDIEDVVTVMMR